jgi:tRNA (guanosine-2'-O-)-methyltransferase
MIGSDMRRNDVEVLRLDQEQAGLIGRQWTALTACGWTAAGVIEVLEPLVHERRRVRIREVVTQRLGSVVVVLDAPHDPHNGAAILRSCDAFGVQHLHVVERLEPFALSARVAQGTERWVNVHRTAEPTKAIEELHQRGFELVATHPEGNLLPEDLATIPRLALVLGNEHEGICQQLAQATERSVRVPMRGFVESLNVSVSAGILLAAATRGRVGDLSPNARQRLYADGLMRTVSRSADILMASRPL